MNRAVPIAVVAALCASAQAVAETKPASKTMSRAESEAKLRQLFPSGHRAAREGVMKLGGSFRTVSVRTWEGCRELCLKNPAEPGGGCMLWTFVKADDAKLPNVCRMWWELPELRENPQAVSGPGKFK